MATPSVLIRAPESWWNATAEERDRICDGCGTPFFNVPDDILGVNITLACKIHDWCYTHYQTKEERKKADYDFLWNMKLLINEEHNLVDRHGILYRSRIAYAYYYFTMVRIFGGGYFKYKKGKKKLQGDTTKQDSEAEWNRNRQF